MNIEPTQTQTRDLSVQRLVEAVTGLAVFMLDVDGNVASWTSGAQTIKGYAADEVIGRHFSLFFTEEDRRTGKPAEALVSARANGRAEWHGWRVRKDRSRFFAQVVMDSIRDQSGSVVGFAKVTRDISAQRRLEERARRIIEFSPYAMLMVNASGTIEMVNIQAEQVFGYPRETLIGRPMETLLPERYHDRHPGMRTAFLASPQSRPMGAGRDLHAVRRDGSEFPVEVALNPIDTEDGTMVLAAIADISDRKQKEERIKAALKEKEIMLGEIHHRVKNNLQIVYSLLDLQSSGIEDAVALGLLRESQNRVKSMALIHQMLYEANDFVQVDFAGFLDNLVPTLISAYGIDPGRITLFINAAHVRLPINAAVPCGLVVNELIANALKHAFPGNRPGAIRVDIFSEPDDRVVLSVSDDGAGMPDGLDIAESSTLGLQLVTLLAEQLKADLTINRANPTRIELRFRVSDVE
nr:PAS domain S-box protein [uncultured Rhodopila sp.]